MKDINDKDFGQNTITLRNNRVATSIIPRTNAELDRQVIVDTDVLVEGSIYAKFLEISNVGSKTNSQLYPRLMHLSTVFCSRADNEENDCKY